MKKTLEHYLYYLYSFLNCLNSVLIAIEIQTIWSAYYYKHHIFNLAYWEFHYHLLKEGSISHPSFISVIITFGVSLCSFVFNQQLNLYQKIAQYSRFATRRDIKLMDPPVLKRTGIVLGSLGFLFKQTLKTNEPLGVLCVAPAGAGKTTGSVIPTILSSNEDSLIINDPKGELYDITHKYRRSLGGKVTKIEWGEKLENRNEFTASWNPLAIENIPLKPEETIEYIEILVNVLIVDSNANNLFWTNSAKKALTSIMLYLVATSQITNKDTTIFACKELIANMGTELSDSEEKLKQSKKMSNINFGFFLLSNNVLGLDISIDIQKLCSRVFTELSNLATETLQSVIASVDVHLNIFNNLKAVSSTSKNTIKVKDIRGEKNKPNTIYLVSPAAEQKSYGVLSALFVELAYRFCTSEDFKTIKNKNIVRFILDEVAFFPKINAVSDGPAIGRGYRCSFLFVCQDLAQFRNIYGDDGLNNIFTNTAYKIVLPQNNDVTAKRLAGLSGNKREFEYISTADKKRIKKPVFKPLIEPLNILHMPKGKQIVFIQNNAATPISCNIPFWFKNRDMKKKIKQGNKWFNKTLCKNNNVQNKKERKENE